MLLPLSLLIAAVCKGMMSLRQKVKILPLSGDSFFFLNHIKKYTDIIVNTTIWHTPNAHTHTVLYI